MTGIRPRRAALRIIPDGTPPLMPKLLTHARAEQILKIDKLQNSLNALHKESTIRNDERRKRSIAKHNTATNIITPRFNIGDFVLVRRQDKAHHKLCFKWVGPRRIKKTISDLVYIVERLDGGRDEKVHCARIIPYAYGMDGTEVPQELLDIASALGWTSRFKRFHMARRR